MTSTTSESNVENCSLITIAHIFLRLGATAFGGPAAHIALMENEFVQRRKWISQDEFLDLLGASNLVPGPSSTELAMHIGRRLGRLAGLVTAGVCFILPSALFVAVIAHFYVHFGTLPEAHAILVGLKPVVIALVFQAILAMRKTVWKSSSLMVASIFVVALSFFGLDTVFLLFGTGLLASIFRFIRLERKRESARSMAMIAAACSLVIGISWLLSAPTKSAVHFSYSSLFLYFLKTGSLVYGSGYVLLAFLRNDLVLNYHWLSPAQLLDAVAAGQITPGPVFTAATFIGYLLGGPLAALISTLAIFLPAFFFVAVSSETILKMRTSILASAFFDAVNAAAFALMVAVLIQLAQGTLIDLPSIGIALLSAIALLKFKINPVLLMLAGALLGFLFQCR